LSGGVRVVCALVVLSFAMPARADEPARVRVETEGECPTTAALETALASLDIGTDGAGDDAWVVRAIHPAHGATRLELVPPLATAPVESRAIASPDCEALAQTFALIVHTHFTELGVEVAPPAPVVVEAVEVAPPEVEASVFEAPAVAPPAPIPMRWELGLGVLGGVSVEPLLPSLVGQIDASWLPEASGPFVLRVLFAASTPTSQSTRLDEVSRWTLRPGLEAGARFGGTEAWIEFLGGVLVDVAAISAVGVPAFWRAQPGIDLAIGFAIHAGGVVWVRVEASDQIWLTYDRYLVDPDGLIAQSPRNSTVLGLSAVFSLTD
jgi:hypothetical protein